MNKYFWVSVLLIIASVAGIWWLINNKGIIKTSEQKREEAINAIYPTVTVSKKQASPTSMIVGQPGTKGGLDEDGATTQTIFESVYSPDRKIYIEKEYSGTRYVLWRSDSKITLHVGNSWSWIHPRRDLTETGVVSGEKVFVYSIGSQKIVDFIDGGKKYTIQCVHNGNVDNKAECDKFISNFKLL